jgi:hypothetical protein
VVSLDRHGGEAVETSGLVARISPGGSMSRRGVSLILAAMAAATLACEADDLFSIDLSGAVVTVVDSGPALSAAVTFVLPDTIIETPLTASTIGHAADHEITNDIRLRLVAFGWQDLGNDSLARPDVVVLVAASTRIQTAVVYDDWFGAWSYLPYWGAPVDASWAWGVPSGVEYAFPAGTLLISMLDLRAQRTDTKSIPLLWAAAIDGVLSNPENTTDRALLGINQAFAQSAYLDRSP